MSEKKTIEKAQQDQREGKAPTTQAGEFIREEIHHIREGKHGARSAKQAIAIGLSKARRAGVNVPRPGHKSKSQKSSGLIHPPGGTSAKRSRAIKGVLKREGSSAAHPGALSRQALKSAARRNPQERSESARKASHTKGPAERSAAAKKAARNRTQSR